ncbi:MAG: hypothetical protein HY549_07345 [Elusimicrobia bacterium]|nr:hypothetical protein [Elusimicrobiota bacterium]
MMILIMSLLALTLGNSLRYLMRSQAQAQAEADLQEDATQIINAMSAPISLAGNGIPNSQTAGKSIFATADIDTHTITFFHRDVNGSDTIDAGDEWKRLTLSDGRILEQTFVASGWNNINSLAPASERAWKQSPASRITRLEFNFYSSDEPPRRIVDARAASRVRIHLELEKGQARISKDAWITLKNVINAQQIP